MLGSLREDQTLSYGDLQARAETKGLKIAPIMYGRAKALLGIVPVAPRAKDPNRKSAARASSTQPLPQTDVSRSDPFSLQLDNVKSVEDLVRIVKLLDNERRRLRGLLEQISNTIDETLGYVNDEQ